MQPGCVGGRGGREEDGEGRARGEVNQGRDSPTAATGDTREVLGSAVF